MKTLYFRSVFPAAPQLGPQLMRWANTALQPFESFLGRASDAAKERQVRCRVGWERVRNLSTLTLEALDTRIRILRPPPRWLVTNWDAGVAFDVEKPLMVVNRDATVRVARAEHSTRGVWIEPAEPLDAADEIYWCGRRCVVEAASETAAPRVFTTLGGTDLPVRAAFVPEGDDAWTGVLEGVLTDSELFADGVSVRVSIAPALDAVRRLFDVESRVFELTGGVLKVEDHPAEGPLRADNGVRFTWRPSGARGRSERWVQLVAPTLRGDDLEDPRAAFCGEDVKEVWTEPRHRQDAVIKVRRVDRERYQILLERLPPDGATLHLPLDRRNLQLQQRAARQLTHAPLPHHRSLLRLCVDPSNARWPAVTPRPVSRWTWLTDESLSGTDEQRAFVAMALGSPDFALLEGPPGSGKSTAICELVDQLVASGQRVLLCATTHVAIDNVLERLLGSASASNIDAVRIGRLDRVDEAVHASHVDRRVEALLEAWRSAGAFATAGDAERRDMAERTVIMGANLTCGTTLGILAHPLFRDRAGSAKPWEDPVATAPHWDVMILDEASKTLTQEFLVPALLARRHVIVGDVRQLPPFSDRANVTANIEALLPRDHQRAALLLFRLGRKEIREAGVRWLVVERPGVIQWIARELAATSPAPFSVARVTPRRGGATPNVVDVTVSEVAAGEPTSLHLAAADIVLVGDDVFPQVSARLPADLVPASELGPIPESDAGRFRHAWWAAALRPLHRGYRERRADVRTAADAEVHEGRWLAEHDFGDEVAWRLTRHHELRRSRNPGERDRLDRDVRGMLPRAASLQTAIDEIADIGFPSVLEVLQEGVGAARADRRSTLTEGLGGALDARFRRLSFQHRMHPEISAFARETFYDDSALRDANTIGLRDAKIGWRHLPFASRRVWVDVRGHERDGENEDEARAIVGIVREFVRSVARLGPPARPSLPRWEVACLSFYAKQEQLLARMLSEATGDTRSTRFRWGDVDIVCGTVDRFQGREADLVLLSMRNTGRVGFLNSPNRLNVALTRARQQLVIVGKRTFFERCDTGELEALATRTAREDGRRWMGGRR